MNDDFISGAWQTLCDGYVAERKQHGEAYVMSRWSLSKSRLNLFTKFSKFCRMCRDEGLAAPLSPDIAAPVLRLPQKRWMDTWNMCYQRSADTAQSIQSLMDHVGINTRKRPPDHVVKRNRVRKASQTLAEIGDGEALVDQIGPHGLGKQWPDAVRVVIDADQARMDRENG